MKLAKAASVMKGFRAYFKVPSTGDTQLSIRIDDDAVTAVDGVEADEKAATPSAIYSVDGVYMGTDLNALPHGVYIIKGKKVVK